MCFLFGALLPVHPVDFGEGGGAELASVLIGVVAAAVVGALIGRFAERSMLWTATRQVLILLAACGVTYLIGKALGVSTS